MATNPGMTFDEVYKGYGIRIREADRLTATIYWSTTSPHRFQEVFSVSHEEGRAILLERCRHFIDEDVEPFKYGPDFGA